MDPKVTEITQSVLDELNKELTGKQNESILLEGALKGVNFLYTRLLQHEQDNQTTDSEIEPGDTGPADS